MARLAAQGERFDLVAGASSGSVCAAVTVAGLAEEGPAMWRSMVSTPVVSARYLATERSVFGMSAILRSALDRYLPEDSLQGTHAELLVATTRARQFAQATRATLGTLGALGTGGARTARATLETLGRRGRDALVVHSNRTRRDMHDVIVASCYIPIIYARVPRLDGEVHIDGGAADNTLIDELIARGADDITMVTPYPHGGVARTLFDPEQIPTVPPHVRLRLIYPIKRLAQKHFDFAPGPLEEALSMPHEIRVIERVSERVSERADERG